MSVQSGNNLNKEVGEALNVGQRALNSLYQAREELKSARNWGYLDMLGGGMLVTFAKHSRINNAVNCLNQAKRDLQSFSKEVQDVDAFEGVDLGLGDFAVFADYFFDGLIADFYVQSKINEASSQVETAIERVNALMNRLQNM